MIGFHQAFSHRRVKIFSKTFVFSSLLRLFTKHLRFLAEVLCSLTKHLHSIVKVFFYFFFAKHLHSLAIITFLDKIFSQIGFYCKNIAFVLKIFALSHRSIYIFFNESFVFSCRWIAFSIHLHSH